MADPDYQLGNITQTISGEVALAGLSTLHVDASVILGPQSARKVAEQAAQAVGLEFSDITITSEPDSSGDPSFFFTYWVPGAAITGKMQSDLMGELRDLLLAGGDKRYPYVTLTAA